MRERKFVRGVWITSKMAATPIYGKNPLKIFSRTKRPMTLGLGLWHLGLGPNKVCSNDDLGLTLTFFYGKVKFASLCICMYMKNIHLFLREKC